MGQGIPTSGRSAQGLPAARSGEQARLASPWGAVQTRFLTSLPPSLQRHIYDLSVETAAALQRWAAGYPAIRTVRVPPLALSVAAAAPFSSAEALTSTARLSLWVFTVDDWFDEECVPEPDVLARVEQYRTLAHGEALPTHSAAGSLPRALADIREDLARYPLFDALGSEWANALVGTLEGMLQEYRWRAAPGAGVDGRVGLPEYEAYVAAGRFSIGGPPHIWAAVITTNDLSTPEHLEHLRAMEKEASTCIRLANDLQSYQKEVREGNVNSLVILQHALRRQGVPPAAAWERAEGQVRAEIAAGLDRLARLRTAAVTRTGYPEAAIDNIARFVCDFYAHHDFHTFLSEVP